MVNQIEEVLKPAVPAPPVKRRTSAGVEEANPSKRKKDHGTPTPPKLPDEKQKKDKKEKKEKKEKQEKASKSKKRKGELGQDVE